MRTVDLTRRKRDGEELASDEIAFVVDHYTRGDIQDYQMSAFLMAAFFSGLSDKEAETLTLRMLSSGETIDLSSVPGVKVDKHSTGGVGDKTSLIAAPLAGGRGRDGPDDFGPRSRTYRWYSRQAGVDSGLPGEPLGG